MPTCVPTCVRICVYSNFTVGIYMYSLIMESCEKGIARNINVHVLVRN